MTSNLPKHKFSTITASGSVCAVASRVYGISVQAGASAAGKASLFNNTDGSGTAFFSIGAPANDYNAADFENLGPLAASTGLYVTLSGSAASAHLWWE